MKELNLDKPSENIDYTLEPAIVEGADTWNVNLKRAPYDNITIRYNNVRIDGEKQSISFTFDVVDTQDPIVYNTDNTQLQSFAGEVLGDILDSAIQTGSLQKKDSNDGHQSTADDSPKSTD